MNARALTLIGALLAGWVLLLAATTPVPSEDGVSYLWMAQRFAAGDCTAALATVFPPGYSLLLAPAIALGAAPEAAAHWLGAITLAATLWPLARLAASLGGPAAAGPAVLLFAASPLLSRLGAEVYSEPPFLLLMAWGACAALRERWFLVGLCSALAFWIRPEGSLLAASYMLVQPRQAWRALLPVAGGVLALATLRWWCGHGFDPLPIHAFHEQRDDLPERGRLFSNLLALPGPWCEAFALAGLLVLPCLRWQPKAARPLVWQVLLQVAVILTFVVRRRFFVSCAIAVHALAGPVLAKLRKPWRVGLLAAALLLALWSGATGGIEANRAVERDLGEWLRPQLRSGERLVCDLPRVVWYAGQPPQPPRHHTAAQMAAMVAAPEVTCVVLRTRGDRSQFTQLQPQLLQRFERKALPEPLAAAADARGVAVFVRR